jgi:hypothetical protein
MKLRSKLLIFLAVAFLALTAWKAVIPNLVRAKTTSRHGCINNLRQMEAAIQQWAQENKQSSADRITMPDITPYLLNNTFCPQGGKYTIGPAVSNGVACSFPGHTLSR